MFQNRHLNGAHSIWDRKLRWIYKCNTVWSVRLTLTVTNWRTVTAFVCLIPASSDHKKKKEEKSKANSFNSCIGLWLYWSQILWWYYFPGSNQ